MKKPVIVRIKGSSWEVMTPESSGELDMSPSRQAMLNDVPDQSGGKKANAILLDLALKHFRALRPTATEARKLAGALRRSLRGESVDVGPIGPGGRLYNFRRRVNAISIRAGEARMRLPIEAAKALVKPLRETIRPKPRIKTA